MAKLRVKNLNKVRTNIRKRVTKALRDKSIREGVGEIVVDQIQKEPVPVTSEATKSWRKYLEKNNPTSIRYNRRFINITFTGELLKDLMKNVKAKFSKGSVEYVIEHSDKKHKKYKKPNGRPLKGTRKSYSEISDFIIDKGYDYLTFSEKSKTRVIRFIRDKVGKLIK